ncbi:Ribosyldihydronicotinamide dehydrogenase [Fusarium oxysporum f. sp. rapae]|uniref:Ribosyldihydronicotinamide dehydrogenase n=1 Tax=Fusarium oxysporum f. sp. rapae TaxID=485398 RepID=A0A8J5NMB5_FUSOX|nr:Ribosyldihydronicotinamide dehydrogenase [Fusarium oxysporum f. sp. rapae]
MKVLIVLAHPEPQSFNGSLFKVSVNELKAQGHQVKTSDLYSMKWKSEIDRADFPSLATDARLKVAYASRDSYAAGNLTEDVKTEQEKLLWADVVLIHFPLWWYTMPAILKGWVERVFSMGFAYGYGEHSDKHYGDRYGEGVFAGKRAMLVVTAGGQKEHFSTRGIAGHIDDLLYPINHGVLYYPGFQVLPSHVVYQTDRLDQAGFEKEAEVLREKLRHLDTTEPIAYRPQNGGDYEIPKLTLKPGLGGKNATGFSIHIRNGGAAEDK